MAGACARKYPNLYAHAPGPLACSLGVGDMLGRDNQFVVPRIGDRIADTWVLARVVREQPDLPIFLVCARAAGTEVVRAPVDDERRRLSFPGNPQLHKAIGKLIVHPWSHFDMDLERHPLVRKITEAVPCGRERAFSLIVIQTEGRGHGVLHLKVCTVPRSRERLRKWVIRSM